VFSENHPSDFQSGFDVVERCRSGAGLEPLPDFGAPRDKCSIRQVNMTISLAFLAPELVKAAVEGRLPRGIGVTRLRDAPAEWSRQYAMLGLSI
jgi:hypothetical protein